MKGCANLQPNNIDNIGNIINIDNMSNLFTRQELIDIARGRERRTEEVTNPDGTRAYKIHCADNVTTISEAAHAAGQKWAHK